MDEVSDRDGRLFLVETELLHVDSLHHFLAVGHRGLLESLTGTELAHDARLLKFTFEFLESFLDVLAFFYLYDNHFKVFLMFDFYGLSLAARPVND